MHYWTDRLGLYVLRPRTTSCRCHSAALDKAKAPERLLMLLDENPGKKLVTSDYPFVFLYQLQSSFALICCCRFCYEQASFCYFYYRLNCHARPHTETSSIAATQRPILYRSRWRDRAITTHRPSGIFGTCWLRNWHRRCRLSQAPSYCFKKLQRVQNNAARIVLQAPRWPLCWGCYIGFPFSRGSTTKWLC